MATTLRLEAMEECIMTTIYYPNFLFRVDNIPKFSCITCGDTMVLILIEPLPRAEDRFHIRTFSCKACEVLESYVIDLSQP